MDLVKLQKAAILVPTPGQPEQEYLGEYLMEKGLFCTVKQNDLLSFWKIFYFPINPHFYCKKNCFQVKKLNHQYVYIYDIHAIYSIYAVLYFWMQQSKYQYAFFMNHLLSNTLTMFTKIKSKKI